MFGAALVFETRLPDDIAACATARLVGLVTQAVLWVGLATSMIYVDLGLRAVCASAGASSTAIR